MTGYWQRLDALLRLPSGAGRQTPVLSAPWWLAAQVLLFGVAYGTVMGTFQGLAVDRLWQVAYSAAKVPLLLLATFAVSLPGFFVINTLFGVRDDFREAVRALLGAQAILTVILASLAPFTAFWYASSADYSAATAFNGLMFAVATFAAQLVLRHSYRPLVARNPRHQWLLRTWLLVYVFVGIQMAWVLRPFIGDPRRAVRFFRDDAWGNAYVEVAHLLWNLAAR